MMYPSFANSINQSLGNTACGGKPEPFDHSKFERIGSIMQSAANTMNEAADKLADAGGPSGSRTAPIMFGFP
jgi:hypothetical protein